MGLTGAQQQAATHSGSDICVVAGPGSGKTSVLVERFCWLVSQQQISPDRILTITFTERAANEIKRRLASRFAHDPENRARIERAFVSTVHGFCTRLLKENSIAAGLDPDFGVLDEKDAALLLRQSIDHALDEFLISHPERLRDLYEHWAVADPTTAIAEVYEAIRLSGAGRTVVAPPSLDSIVRELREVLLAAPPPKTDSIRRFVDCVSAWIGRASEVGDPTLLPSKIVEGVRYAGALKPFKEPIERAQSLLVSAQNAARITTLDDILTAVQDRYGQTKRERSLVDFDDLEAFTIEMLSRDTRLRALVQSRFDYMLMDELQDTNPLQWQLVELIRSEGRFFAVGDINQAIYGFRHATPDAFRAFRDRATATGAVVHLRDNFRSRAEIVSAACSLTAGEPGMETPDLQASREFATPGHAPVEHLVIEPANGDFGDLEAQTVCSRILDLVGNFVIETRTTSRPAQYRDIAILFRTGKRFPEFERWLQRVNIPYVLNSGKAFHERQEVLDLSNWMRVLANTLDEIALVGVLRSPLVGIADETLLRLREGTMPLIEALRASRDPQIVEFVRVLEECRAQKDDVSPDRLAAQILDASNYEASLDATGRANVRKLLGLMREYSEKQPGPLARLTERLLQLRQAGEEPNAPIADPGDAVELMTIHAAKGLEFPIVFLVGLDVRGQSDSGGLCYSPQFGLGAKWRHGMDERHDHAAQQYLAANKERRKEEASRLFYVGLTRAEQKLFLTHGPAKSDWVKLLESFPVTATVATPPEFRSAAAVRAMDFAAEEFVSPSADVDQTDSAVTATDVALYADCPRRYLLERYIGWQRTVPDVPEDVEFLPDPGEFRATELGDLVHRVLAGEEISNIPADAAGLAAAFSRSSLSQQANSALRCEREFPFTVEIEGVVLNGQIDLWFQNSEGITLVDYKTDRLEPAEIANTADAYAVQLRLYAAVLQRITGELPRRAVLHFLRPDRLVEIDVTRKGVDSALAQIRALRNAQQSMNFPLREAMHCKRCPHYRGACPSKFGQEQLGLFESGGGGWE